MKLKNRLRRWLFLNHTEQELAAFNDQITLDNLQYLHDYCLLFIPLYFVTGMICWYRQDLHMRQNLLLAVLILLLIQAALMLRRMIRKKQRKYSRVLCTAFIMMLYASAVYYDRVLHPESISVMQCIALVGIGSLFDGYPRINLNMTVGALLISLLIEHQYARETVLFANTFNYIFSALLGCYIGWYRSKNHYESLIHQKEQAEAQERESRVRIMLSQIQPHFMCNVLSTISVLCDLDVEQAKLAIDQLCSVIRGNIDAAVGSAQMIPIARELEQVKNYAALEQMRFGKKLKIIYDIADINFLLPSLTIQPILENAVNHGVGNKPGGGTVTITIREEEDANLIIIHDDGCGVNADRIEDIPIKKDGREHLGLASVKERVSLLTGGSVSFHSRSGEGTSVCITIPKGAAGFERIHSGS